MISKRFGAHTCMKGNTEKVSRMKPNLYAML